MKFRHVAKIVEAHRWWKNGDHPDDQSVVVYPDSRSSTQFEPFSSEGKVVRWLRTPTLDGESLCHCSRPYSEHGWIVGSAGGRIVHPGDWIITVDGRYYPCNPCIFAMLYEIIENQGEKK
jgi:hypothetical protein